MKKPVKDVKIAFRKPIYPINEELYAYLDKYQRTTKIELLYDDLLRFIDFSSIEDENGKDTLWLSVYYHQSEQAEIEENLNRIYTLLHSDGDEDNLPFLTVDSIEYCTFGNSKPFRIRVRNILNDNYTNYYVKKADASRIYGLELEDLLSPHRINYLVFQDTLIEEHILGIPGDVFIEKHLPECNLLEQSQIAKEFVKFNERCFIGLLGDMRSYNYVIIPIHDYNQVIYRIRPIDFDQQCYEGNLKIYRPQYFKENRVLVELVEQRLKKNSVGQYQREVRSLLTKRLMNSPTHYRDLMEVMKKDCIAPQENVDQLKTALQKLTYDRRFEKCETMGEILSIALRFLIVNYKK